MCFNSGNCDSSCLWWIIIIVLVLCFCGNSCGNGCGNGCNSNNGCC